MSRKQSPCQGAVTLAEECQGDRRSCFSGRRPLPGVSWGRLWLTRSSLTESGVFLGNLLGESSTGWVTVFWGEVTVNAHLGRAREIGCLQDGSVEGAMARGENREVTGGPIVKSLEGHGKEFAFFPQSNGEPLHNFRSRNKSLWVAL